MAPNVHFQWSPSDCRGKLFYCHLVPKRVPVSDSDRRSERVNVTHFCTVCPGSLHWLSQMAAFNVESTGEAWCILYNALHYIDGSLTKQGKQLCLGGERLVEEMGGGRCEGISQALCFVTALRWAEGWRRRGWCTVQRHRVDQHGTSPGLSGAHWAFVPLVFVS